MASRCLSSSGLKCRGSIGLTFSNRLQEISNVVPYACVLCDEAFTFFLRSEAISASVRVTLVTIIRYKGRLWFVKWVWNASPISVSSLAAEGIKKGMEWVRRAMVYALHDVISCNTEGRGVVFREEIGEMPIFCATFNCTSLRSLKSTLKLPGYVIGVRCLNDSKSYKDDEEYP